MAATLACTPRPGTRLPVSGGAELPAPAGLSVTADSQGLAVSVGWQGVDGAAGYRVYRATAAAMVADDTTLLAATSVPSWRDDRATAGQTLYYRVRAVDAGGVAGAASAAAMVTTSDGMADSRARALAWLNGQQEGAQGFRTTFDGTYGPAYKGRVEGRVADLDELPPVITAPYVAFSQAYSSGYVGPVSGTWGNVAPRTQYRVDVYSRSDVDYLQGSFALRADGTWTSGKTRVRAGAKSARLVRVADNAQVARSGWPRRVVSGVAVEVYTRVDTDRHLATVPLGADGTFAADGIDAGGGRLTARLANTATGRALNSTEWAGDVGYPSLVRSFTIPFNDPAYGYAGGAVRGGFRPEQRSWIYDDALAVFAFTATGQRDRAGGILRQLADLQQGDGALAFSYDVRRGQPFDQYIRSGALAWVGSAALAYEESTGDLAHRSLAVGVGEYLLRQQVSPTNGFDPSDQRFGSVLGGYGRYDENFVFVAGPIAWASTEHNIDAYFLLRDLGYLTGDDRYAQAASMVRQSLLTHHWNSAEERFNQGVSGAGPDTADALDLGSWGGLFLLAVGERTKAERSAQYVGRFRVTGADIRRSSDPGSFNETYTSAGPIDGYQPYGRGYDDPPRVVWAEGTLGAALLRLRLGHDISADLQSMRRLQAADPAGGFVQVTQGRAAPPYEFHVWPSVAGTAWAVLLTRDPGLLWRPDRR
ncbi:hypothetical protein [Luedemannella flava]|uniref:hypothetical protein n=1 Tax=Luedemannella flava TaxID=349316 RepID=UPI0031D3F0D3